MKIRLNQRIFSSQWVCTVFLLVVLQFAFAQSDNMISRLEIFTLENSKRTLILEEIAHFEAPNWSLDGSYFIINQEGLLYKVSFDGKTKVQIPTGKATQCNNDHGISPDGTLLAISNNDLIEGATNGSSRIYVLPIAGGEPILITTQFPSYWHGWAPNNKEVVYTAYRDGDFNIFRTALDNAAEIQLTEAAGLDDGPEYSPDGTYIYYNSFKSGVMELWRMKPDGNEKKQLTDDPYSNWFPHPSPDGKYLVYLSYMEDQGQNHPAMQNVALRLFDLQDHSITTLTTFTGGQGTINVPSWSPDSKHFAFVSYLTSN